MTRSGLIEAINKKLLSYQKVKSISIGGILRSKVTLPDESYYNKVTDKVAIVNLFNTFNNQIGRAHGISD